MNNFSIQLKKDCKSFVWLYFGYLENTSNHSVLKDQVYCSVCFADGKTKKYKENVSTTNLAQHLREAHGILCLLVLTSNSCVCCFCTVQRD